MSGGGGLLPPMFKVIYYVPETRLTAHPDASMEEITVTLPNENTEEEPMAPVGGRSETGKARRPGIVFWLNLPN